MPRPRLFIALALAVACLGPAAGRAQEDGQSEAIEGVALVIGNEAYTDLPDVGGSTADAAAVAVYLRQIGFEVLQYVNLTQGEMLAASQRFIGKLRPGEVGIVYFSGHVVQYKDNNYLVPTNARLDRATSILSAGLPLNTLIRRSEEAGLSNALYFLEGGLAMDPTGDGAFAGGMAEPPATTIPSVFALAVEPNATIPIADPTLGDFTALVLAQATRPGISLRQALDTAREQMAALRGSGPAPWIRDGLDEPFVMSPRDEPLAIEVSEERIWDTIEEEESTAEQLTALSFYLQLYPDGIHADEARRMQAALLDGTGLDGTGQDGADPGSNSVDEEPVGTVEADGNRPPTFDGPAAVTLAAGSPPLTLGLPAPVDPEGEALSIEVATLPAAAEIARDGTPLAVGDILSPDELAGLTATPGPAAAGEGQPFRLTITDTGGASLTATIRFEVVAGENRPPVAVDLGAVEIPADAGATLLSIPAPSDPDGDPLTLEVAALPKFGEIMVGDANVAAGQELSLADLASLAYAPNPGQSGDAGALALVVRDAHGNAVRFAQPITVTPAPTAEGAAPWDAAAAAAEDLVLTQRALQALDLYSGTLDGVFGRGSQAALARYQATLGVEETGILTARERAELAVAGAGAVAESARAIAAEAEAAAEQAQAMAHSDEAVEVSWAAGIYRGQVNGTTLEGYGVLQASNGQSFAGVFADSEPSLGVHLFQSDSRYAGQERDRVPHGLGVYTYPSGVVFAGEWTGGQIEGLGVSQSPLGVTVEGEWSANAPNGYGAVTDDANGRRIGRMEAGRFTAAY